MVLCREARAVPAELRQPVGGRNSFNLLDTPSSTPTTQTVRMSRAQKAKPRVWQPKSILSKNMRRARKLDGAAQRQKRNRPNTQPQPTPISHTLGRRETRSRSWTHL